MERKIAERGRYPAINVLKSVSRTMPGCNTEDENQIISVAKQLLSTYEDMSELIRLGAYRKGTDQNVDAAIHYYPMLEQFMTQQKEEHTSLEDCYVQLAEILNAGAEQVEQPVE